LTPALTALWNGSSPFWSFEAAARITIRPLSVLPLARPRPGKCFAVAATPFAWRPSTKAWAICAFHVRESEKTREPSKLPAGPGVSTTGAKSMSIPTERRAAAAPAAWS